MAGLGRGVAGAYVGVLGRPAAGRQYPGRDWGFQSSPQSAAFPPRLLRVGIRVGLLIPKATEGLFKLEAGFALTGHSAGCEDGVVGSPRVRVDSAARACPAESSKATAVCKHPAAANQNLTWGLGRVHSTHGPQHIK
jgi:hypothetical protein